MSTLTRSPYLISVVSFSLLYLSARIGERFRRKRPSLEEGARQDLDVILTATLTLLGLIIGFSFSMAITRYDQRKMYEEGEANAIGTEYARADLLPSADAARVRTLLLRYLDQRIIFYDDRDEHVLQQNAVSTAQLQNEMWATVQAPALERPTPVIALAVSGMNEVLNSEGYTQAAWWNRIPVAAWGLIVLISVACNLLFGYSSHRAGTEVIRLLVLPVVLSVAFFFVADIDSPRRGAIRVYPQNLIRLAESLHAQ
jgi:hypothetical protein